MIYDLEPVDPAVQRPEWDYQVELGAAVWRFVVRWFERFGAWALTVYDSDGTLQLSQEWLRINSRIGAHHTGRMPTGGQLWFVALDGSDTEATYDDMGGRCRLQWITDDDDLLVVTEEAGDFTFSATP